MKRYAQLSKDIYSKHGSEAAGIEFMIVDDILVLRGTGPDVKGFKLLGMIKDIITDIKFIPTRIKGGNRHPAGFYKAAIALSKHPAIRTHPRPLTITGHSLGGAVGLILGDVLMKTGRQVTNVITFGAPKVGKLKYLHWSLILQFKNRSDIVTSLGLLPHPTVQEQLGKPRWRWSIKDHGIDRYIEAL